MWEGCGIWGLVQKVRIGKVLKVQRESAVCRGVMGTTNAMSGSRTRWPGILMEQRGH